jgi:hypothetical protein
VCTTQTQNKKEKTNEMSLAKQSDTAGRPPHQKHEKSWEEAAQKVPGTETAQLTREALLDERRKAEEGDLSELERTRGEYPFTSCITINIFFFYMKLHVERCDN